MGQQVKVELDGVLDGHYVVVEVDEITFGDIEDLQSQKAGPALDVYCRLIVESDLPSGHDRNGLRKLKKAEAEALAKGVNAAFAVPKS